MFEEIPWWSVQNTVVRKNSHFSASMSICRGNGPR